MQQSSLYEMYVKTALKKVDTITVRRSLYFSVSLIILAIFPFVNNITLCCIIFSVAGYFAVISYKVDVENITDVISRRKSTWSNEIVKSFLLRDDQEDMLLSEGSAWPLNQLTSSSLDATIQQILDFVLRDYLCPLLDENCLDLGCASGGKVFEQQIRQDLWQFVEKLTARLANIDQVSFLSRRVTNIVCSHLQGIRVANRKCSTADGAQGDAVHCEKFVLRSFLQSEQAEQDFLRKFSDVLLCRLALSEYWLNDHLRMLIGEILMVNVLYPAIQLVCDPDYLNKKFNEFIEFQHDNTRKLHSTYTYTASYEDFVKVINRSDDIEELKQMRYRIITEIMQSTIVQSLKVAQGLSIDEEFSPKGTNKAELLKSRNLTRYTNQLKIARLNCERRILRLGGHNHRVAGRRKTELPGSQLVLPYSAILQEEASLNCLMKYLEHQGRQDLLRFWLAVENMKNTEKSQLHETAAQICGLFLAHSVDVVRQKLGRQILKGLESFLRGDTGPEAFFAAQEVISEVIEEEHYPSFILSTIYHRHILSSSSAKGFTAEEHHQEVDCNVPTSPKRSRMDSEEVDHRRISVLEERIRNKSQALNALLKRSDAKSRHLVVELSKELELLQKEKHQVEFNVERLAVWFDNLGNWVAKIFNSQVVIEDDCTVVYFVIVVHLSSVALPQPGGTHTDGWAITKKLQDFHDLRDQLVELCPSLAQLELPDVCCGSAMDATFLEHAAISLDNLLMALLVKPQTCESHVVFTFFTPSQSTSAVGTPLIAKFSARALFSRKRRQNDSIDCEDNFLLDDTDSSSQFAQHDSIAKSLYLLIGEVFELHGAFKFLRKTLISFAKLTYGKSINRQLFEFVEWIVSKPMLVYYLELFRDAYWPDGKLARPSPPRSDEERALEQEKARHNMLTNVPDIVKNLVGEKNAKIGFVKLFECLQDKHLNKHLFYCLLEEFLDELIPELKSEDIFL